MLKRLIPIALLLAFIFSGIVVFIPDEARAADDPFFSGLEKTWDAAGDALASTPNSWDPVGVLSAGDNVTFDATSVTNCDWDVEITLGNFSMLTGYTGTVTQGVTFGCVNYTQTGTDSLFTQGAPLTIGGDFTITDGEFIATDDDLTIPGDWDTDGYTHGNNVVYLTGDDKDLVMAAGDSFYNVTITTGANYTITGTAAVDLRATIDGTLYGGDFDEPLPEFTNEMWPHACPSKLYEHTPTQKYWDTLTLVESPYWLHLIDGELKGLPNENDTGIFFIVMTLTWNDMVTYQNTTLIVCPDTLSEGETEILILVLSLVFCFGLLLAGLKEKTFWLAAGPLWIIIGIAIFIGYGDVFMYVGVGIGMAVFIWGAIDVWKK